MKLIKIADAYSSEPNNEREIGQAKKHRMIEGITTKIRKINTVNKIDPLSFSSWGLKKKKLTAEFKPKLKNTIKRNTPEASVSSIPKASGERARV